MDDLRSRPPRADDEEALARALTELFQEIDPHDELFAPNIARDMSRLYCVGASDDLLGLILINADAAADHMANIQALILARRENRPLRRKARILYIDALYTTRAKRGRGLARRLLAEILKVDESLKADTEIELGTPVTNETAIRFWRKLGLEERFRIFSGRPRPAE